METPDHWVDMEIFSTRWELIQSSRELFQSGRICKPVWNRYNFTIQIINSWITGKPLKAMYLCIPLVTSVPSPCLLTSRLSLHRSSVALACVPVWNTEINKQITVDLPSWVISSLCGHNNIFSACNLEVLTAASDRGSRCSGAPLLLAREEHQLVMSLVVYVCHGLIKIPIQSRADTLSWRHIQRSLAHRVSWSWRYSRCLPRCCESQPPNKSHLATTRMLTCSRLIYLNCKAAEAS